MPINVENLFRRCGLEPRNVNGRPFARLGDFEFTHQNYYTVVDGKVPLAVAEELYSTLVGKQDIRVAGHCGCPPPKEWLTRFDPNGKIAINNTESDKVRAAIASKSGVAEIYEAALADGKYVLTDSEEQYNSYPAFITTYHIDSELGLYIFIQTLKQHKLV